jgi:hypothetical protein
MVAAAIVGAAAVGAVGSTVAAGASKSAANTQAQAAEDAAHLQNDQWNQTQANLAPYMNLGTSNINALQTALTNPMLTKQFTAPSEGDAYASPGYQFTLNQGLKSVQNSAAARGLGVSGAALKGAASYTTGLADSTYNDVFNRALQTFNTNYSSAANNVNRLQSVVGNGQNAAATNGSLGATAVGNIGNTLTSGANAQAAGTVGSANALASGLNGVGNSALTYGLMTNNAGAAAPASAAAAGSNQYGFTI